MANVGIDLLSIRSGTVTAPAGCGKTYLIADALRRHTGTKPILVLTHTNAGVAALRGRLNSVGVPTSAYRLATIDGWAMRLVSWFPQRSSHDLDFLHPANLKPDYQSLRKAAWKMLKAGHVQDLLQASYSRLIVDEYQDCTIHQHAIIYYAASTIPTCVLGDPMQGIFGWPGNELADWNDHVCKHFPLVGQLVIPWRWRNANTEAFGEWLLDVRQRLECGMPIDLASMPPEATWEHLDGTEDRARQMRAALTSAPSPNGSVLIIGDSKNPRSQKQFARQTPGAVAVEAVDLEDLVDFAKKLDFGASKALPLIADFAASVMTNVRASELIGRVGILRRGTGRREPSEVEHTALQFEEKRTPEAAIELLGSIRKKSGVRTHRPTILRACVKALRSCADSADTTFYEAAVRVREENRLFGRPISRRAVGSTLLLKGLEADVSVILSATDLDAKHLYVAMTRGARRLVVCSKTPKLNC